MPLPGSSVGVRELQRRESLRSGCGTAPSRTPARRAAASDSPASYAISSSASKSSLPSRTARGLLPGGVASTATSRSSRVGTRTARDTAAHAFWPGATSHASRTLGWSSKPLKSLCSSFVPSVSRSASEIANWSCTKPPNNWSRALFGHDGEDPLAAIAVVGDSDSSGPTRSRGACDAGSGAAAPRRRCRDRRESSGRHGACGRNRRATAGPSRTPS